ncbi:hypothetical protein DBR18_22780 [Pseudomonas sp. HMWF021]|nr:hypothetical protein DBR18_22780 [Pseudomonas sp. HMWF021]
MRLRNGFQTTLVLERHDVFANFQHTKKTVGAGLPAMASYQPTNQLTDRPLSRASPLPQDVR